MESQEELRQVHQASVLGACKLSARLVASCRAAPHHSPAGTVVVLWILLFSSSCAWVSSTGTGMGTIELRVEGIVFIPIWREFPGVSVYPRPSLPCPRPCQGPGDGAEAAACSSPPVPSPPGSHTHKHPRKHLLTERQLEQGAAQLYKEHSPIPGAALPAELM